MVQVIQMNHSNAELWIKNHEFVPDSGRSEIRTLLVILLTMITMVAEVAAGYVWGSMALLADGWHMGTHVSALLITYAAYYYARSRRSDERFSYGTGKIGVLGGYTSAVVLAGVSLFIAYESAERFINPRNIQFAESITVAVVGLIVNLLSAALLGWGGHHHDHSHHDDTDHHHHEDHNLKAAYFHVLADALTSVLAIGALIIGLYSGWVWLDPVIGLVGSVIILKWAYGLMKETAPILTDGTADSEIMEEVRRRIESYKDTKVTDLHMWRVSSSHYSVQVSLVTESPEPVENYYGLLRGVPCIDHLSVEIFRRKEN